MVQRFTRLSLLIIIFLLAISFIPLRVTSEVYFDSQGKDFWLTFIPNFHNNNDPSSEDSLYIFVTSRFPTSGKIEFADGNGIPQTVNFRITDPKIIYTFKIGYYGYELEGYNDSGSPWFSGNDDEAISLKTFHVTSDTDVTVYALDQANTTSDAFLVLPTDVLGSDYLVMSYNSDGNSAFDPNQRTPSQFAIVASEDNTQIKIVPTCFTYLNNQKIQNIVLDKGQTYLVQAKFTPQNPYPDLTGTEIHSSAPVAIFSGQQRATVPIRTFSSQASRDVLIEQIPPVRTWGMNAFLVPYAQPPGIEVRGNDLYRILAAYDSTDILINNIKVVTLNRGGYYEGPLNAAASVTATRPILVAQFKKTAKDQGSTQLSDPFMMVIPPSEQFMNQYRVINVQAYESAGGFPPSYYAVYQKQYIIIVAPDSILNTVTIDGSVVNQTLFKPIPTSNFYYANIAVTDGVHEIQAQSGVGVYIYGYGLANSYGYVGGMSFKPLDPSPPQIFSVDSCYFVQGAVYDSTMSDSHLRLVVSDPDSLQNVDVKIDAFTPYVPSVKFSGGLVDRRLDGRFAIIGVDSVGHKTEKGYDIPGFTLALNKIELIDSIPKIIDSIAVGKQFCRSFEIHNYGKFPQPVRMLTLAHPAEFKMTYSTPKTIMPGEIDTVTICFQSDADTTLADSLMLTGACETKKLAEFKMKTLRDNTPPKIQRNNDPCNTTINYVFTDSLSSDYGIQSLDTSMVINCTIARTSETSKQLKLTVKVDDPTKDAYYEIVVTDSAGNKTSYIDTIPGFTITFPDWKDTDKKLIDFKSHSIGNLICDSFKMSNYGNFPIKFDNFPLSFNISYSIPQSQFPATIPPGETRVFEVCFHPTEYTKAVQSDTVHISWLNCINRTIVLNGNGIPDSFSSESSCGVMLKMSSSKLPSQVIVDNVYPNPIIDGGKISFSLNGDYVVRVDLYNSLGSNLGILMNKRLGEGSYELNIDTENMQSGMYFIRFSAGDNTVTRYFLINR